MHALDKKESDIIPGNFSSGATPQYRARIQNPNVVVVQMYEKLYLHHIRLSTHRYYI